MVGKEDPAVWTCQQHFDPTPWINQILILLSDSLPARRAKWPQRISVEGNTLSQEKRNKEDGLIWHLQVLGLRAQERLHGILSSWTARIGNRPHADPCADVIWTIPQIHTDQSVFFLSNTEQFPLSAVEKDRGEAPMCSLHESPQIEKILCSSNSHRTATQNFWCFTLKKKKPQMNCQEASATSFPVGASSLQTLKRLAHTWRIYICMTPFSKRNTLQQQQKNRSLQAAEVLKSTDKTTAFTEFNPNRSNIKPHPVWATLVFLNK